MSPPNFQRSAIRSQMKVSPSNLPGDIVVGVPTSYSNFSLKSWKTSELCASEEMRHLAQKMLKDPYDLAEPVNSRSPVWKNVMSRFPLRFSSWISDMM